MTLVISAQVLKGRVYVVGDGFLVLDWRRGGEGETWVSGRLDSFYGRKHRSPNITASAPSVPAFSSIFSRLESSTQPQTIHAQNRDLHMRTGLSSRSRDLDVASLGRKGFSGNMNQLFQRRFFPVRVKQDNNKVIDTNHEGIR